MAPIVERIRTARYVPYTGGNEIEDDEYFLVRDEATLADLAPFRRLATALGGMPSTRPADLDATIGVTAVGFGNHDASRVVAVQKVDPRLGHRGGRFFALGAERLHLLDEPVFAFAPTFDFLVGPEWAVILRQKPFEVLLRHVAQVEQRIGGWVERITSTLPLASGSAEALLEVAIRDSRTWRRLREIGARDLSKIKIEQIADYSVKMGMDVSRVVRNGELMFDPADRFGFLHLLNEDLYRGPLTDAVFEAQRKAAAE